MTHASSSTISPPRSRQLPIGEFYEAQRPIRRGPGTALYEARHRSTGAEVCVELIAQPVGVPGRIRKKALREGRLSARLDHPHVVKIYDVGETPEHTIYIVQEPLEGESLLELVERSAPLRLAETASLLLPVMDALATAHARGIVHGSLSTGHILLCERPRAPRTPKLVDLGLAHHMACDGLSRLTVGRPTPDAVFLFAPERLRSTARDARVDIWGICAVLYECLTGRRPYEGSSLRRLRREVERGDPPAASSWVPALPAAVDAYLARGLARAPEGRFETMRDAMRELRWLVEDLGDTSLVDSAEQPTELFEAPVVRRAAARSASLPDLRVGLVRGVAGLRGPRLASALSEALGLRCAAREFPSYPLLIDALGEGALDLAWLPPVAYVRARRAGLARLLSTVERTGLDVHASALLGRRGVVDVLEQARGRRAAWVDQWSAAGCLLPRAMLRERGVDPHTELGSHGFLGSYDAVLRALCDGSAQIGASFCTLDAEGRIVSSVWGSHHPVTVLALDGPVPADTICCRPDASHADVSFLSQALTDPARSAPILALVDASSLGVADATAYERIERSLLNR